MAMSSNKPNVMNFAQALRMKPGERKAPADSEPPAKSTAAPISAAPAEKAEQPLQIEPAAKTEPPAKSVAPTESVLAAETPHTRIPNEIFETIMPTLKPGAQVVLWRLYRLAAGFNSQTCHVSIGKLAQKTHISETQVREFLKYLEGRGWIKRISVDLSNKNQDARGITFEVRLPRLAPAKIGGGVKSIAPAESEPNKLKALKERDIKGEAAAPDYKNCPDCQGSGFWYPEGVEKGVARCKHERMGTT
jgi:DNA-binding Lrp family transcriptional regulator